MESGSGKIARRIFKLVSNGDALSLLSEEPVVRILERLEKGECSFSELGAYLGQLRLMPPDGELQRLLSSLVRYRVVQFGLVSSALFAGDQSGTVSTSLLTPWSVRGVCRSFRFRRMAANRR